MARHVKWIARPDRWLEEQKRLRRSAIDHVTNMHTDVIRPSGTPTPASALVALSLAAPLRRS